METQGEFFEFGGQIVAQNEIRKVDVDGIKKTEDGWQVELVNGDEHLLSSLSSQPEQLVLVNGEPACVASERYVPVDHYDILKVVKDKFADLGFGVKKGVMRAWDFSMRYNVYFDEFEVEGDGTHYVGLSIHNSLNKASGIHTTAGILRLVCTNGMTVPRLKYGGSLKHVAHNPEELADRLEENIKTAIDSVHNVHNHFEEWTTWKLSREEMTAMVLALNLRKRELSYIAEKRSEFGFDFPVAEGYVYPPENYTAFDYLVDVTEIARNTWDRNPSRASFLEDSIIKAITP